jgi:hypothetical protein
LTLTILRHRETGKGVVWPHGRARRKQGRSILVSEE